MNVFIVTDDGTTPGLHLVSEDMKDLLRAQGIAYDQNCDGCPNAVEGCGAPTEGAGAAVNSTIH